MRNKQVTLLICIPFFHLLISSCYYNEVIGPFRKSPLGRDDFVSIVHFEHNKILFMDFSTTFKEIDSFDWDGYKKYIESPKNEIDSIGFAVSKQDSILNSKILKKFFSRLSYIKENRKIKYGILLQEENKDIFLEKIPLRNKSCLDVQAADCLWINKKNIHKLSLFANSININKKKTYFIYIPINLLHETDIFVFLDKIRGNDVNLFFYD